MLVCVGVCVCVHTYMHMYARARDLIDITYSSHICIVICWVGLMILQRHRLRK